MSRRDFDRVIALANVGSRVAGSTSMYDDGEFAEAKGWKDQKKFALQCHNLTSKAFWWNVLKRLSVAFDFTAFDSAEKEKDPKAYISSLVFDLIRCGSKVIVDPSTVQLLASPVPLLNCGRRRTCRNCHQRGIIPDSDAEGKI